MFLTKIANAAILLLLALLTSACSKSPPNPSLDSPKQEEKLANEMHDLTARKPVVSDAARNRKTAEDERQRILDAEAEKRRKQHEEMAALEKRLEAGLTSFVNVEGLKRLPVDFDYFTPASVNPERAYLTGKTVVVARRAERDEPKDRIHKWLVWELLPDRKPDTPAEVKTVVWVDKTFSAAGAYTDGTRAWRENWKLTLIDLQSKSVIAKVGAFEGEEPPSTTYGNARTGKSPYDQVLKYLNSLPLRTK